MSANHTGCGWVGVCLCARDTRLCRCGHKSISHRSDESGVGNGVCGRCECDGLSTGDGELTAEVIAALLGADSLTTKG